MPEVGNKIKFGTDGWRGIIADDFTFARLALVAPIAAPVSYTHLTLPTIYSV